MGFIQNICVNNWCPYSMLSLPILFFFFFSLGQAGSASKESKDNVGGDRKTFDF